MCLKVGDQIWLPCETRPGWDPNQWFIRIQLSPSSWYAFAHVKAVTGAVETGPTFILAQVVGINGAHARVRVHGHAFDARDVDIPIPEASGCKQ